MSKAETESPTPEATQPPVASALSHEQIEELQNRAAKADENWERLLRTAADLENFKKRAAREKIEAAQYANEVIHCCKKLLPVLSTTFRRWLPRRRAECEGRQA